MLITLFTNSYSKYDLYHMVHLKYLLFYAKVLPPYQEYKYFPLSLVSVKLRPKPPAHLPWLREAEMGVGNTVCNPSPSISVPTRQMSWSSGNPTQFTSYQLLPERISLNAQQCLSKTKDENSKLLPNTQLSIHHSQFYLYLYFSNLFYYLVIPNANE